MDKPLNILSVDDDNNLQSVLTLLYGGTHRIDTANSLAESLVKCAQNRYDLLLLDIHLPDGSGMSLLEQLRKEPRFAHLRCMPVVMISASRDLDDYSRSLDLGSVAYVNKPFEATELSSAIDVAMANA